MRRKPLLSTRIPVLSQPGEVKPAVQQSKLSIDYPQAAENVQRGHYSIRISGCLNECQVAIDDGEWQPCRSAEGFSWYDWYPEQPGTHRISVRVRSGNKWVKTQRACRVV